MIHQSSIFAMLNSAHFVLIEIQERTKGGKEGASGGRGGGKEEGEGGREGEKEGRREGERANSPNTHSAEAEFVGFGALGWPSSAECMHSVGCTAVSAIAQHGEHLYDARERVRDKHSQDTVPAVLPLWPV